MYFLKNSLVEIARQQYVVLAATDPTAADRFFETFGPGQRFSFDPEGGYFPDQPFERFSDYEEFLKLLQKLDLQKYQQIHKGTPFYIMAWLAFDLRNYEKALFYMDAAISEDIRKSPHAWIYEPASSFLTLNSASQVSQLTIESIRKRLEEQLQRFSHISGLPPLSLEQFIEQFVKVLIRDVSKRTIISALYVYLLEYEERHQELRLRSIEGGSIGPVVKHLFTGGVIFESLLKPFYPVQDNGKPVETLGDVFKSSAFINDFGAGFTTSARSLQSILDAVSDNLCPTAFRTTAKLRNTTGHNLIWDDVFANPQQYSILFHQEVNALLYLISAKFL